MGCPMFPMMPSLLPRRNKLRFMESSFITIWIFLPFSTHPDSLMLKKKKNPLSNKDLDQSFGVQIFKGFPGSLAGKESACNAGELGSIPWRRERLATPVFWPGEFHGLYSPWGHKELDTTEWLSLSHLFYLPTEELALKVNGLTFSFPGSISSKEPTCQCRRHKRRGFNLLEESTATYSSNLAWRISWTEDPDGL